MWSTNRRELCLHLPSQQLLWQTRSHVAARLLLLLLPCSCMRAASTMTLVPVHLVLPTGCFLTLHAVIAAAAATAVAFAGHTLLQWVKLLLAWWCWLACNSNSGRLCSWLISPCRPCAVALRKAACLRQLLAAACIRLQQRAV